MIKLTVLALFVALQQGTSAEKDTSRRLLQYYPQPYQPYYPQQNQYGYQPQPIQCAPGDACKYPDPCHNAAQCYADYLAATQPQAPPAAPQTPANPPAANGPPATNPGVTPGTPPVNPPQPPPPAVQPNPVVQTPPQYPPQVGGPPAVGPGGPGLYPIQQPPFMNPAMLGPPLTEATCTGTTPMGMPAVPGTATSCQNRVACPPGPPAAGAPPCAGPMAYNNMAENFKLYCSAPMGCSGSEINMNFGPGQGVRSINQLLFSEAGSGQGSTINVRNDQMIGNVITVERLECSAAGSCGGLTVNMWGASMNDVDCGMAANCAGCVINLWTQEPMPGCPNPGAAPGNPACLIETSPCFGY